MTKLHRRRQRMDNAPRAPLALAAAVAALMLAQFLAPAGPANGQEQDALPAAQQTPGSLDAEQGRETFLKYCSACHNELRKVGPYLAGGAGYFVQAGLPARDFGSLLARKVRNKDATSVMPRFNPDEVSSADLDNIGYFLAQTGAGLAGLDHRNPPAPLIGSAEAGAGSYARHCQICHSPDAMGQESVPPLAPEAALMQELGLPASALHGLLLWACRSGDLEQMPVYSSGDLSDQELADIAAWLWETTPEAE